MAIRFLNTVQVDTDVLYVDAANDRVGIGTTSPSYKLDVSGDFRVKDGSSAIAFNEYNNGATIWLDGSNGDFAGGDYFNISAYGATDLVFGYAASTKMVLKSSGNVGIGTTSPNAKLNVNGSIKIEGSNSLSFGGGSSVPAWGINSSGNNLIINDQATTSGDVLFTNDGGVGIGTTSPSGKLHIEDTTVYMATAPDVFKVSQRSPEITFQDLTSYVAIDTKYQNSAGSTLATHTVQNNPGGAFYKTTFDTGGPGGSEYQQSQNGFHWRINSNSEKLTIATNGNIGINDTTPSYQLDVNGVVSGSRFFVGTNAAASQWAFHARNNSSTADSGLYFNNNSSEIYLRNSSNVIGARIRSDSASYFNGGDVGIGIAVPQERLHVSGETHPSIKLSSSSDGNYNVILNCGYRNEALNLSVGGYKVFTTEGFNTPETTHLYSNNSKALSIASNQAATFTSTVTATNFILSSDERLKENIEEVCDNRVKADWKTFELKTEKGQKRYGVIAQELEKTNPEFVREDSQGFKSVAYIDLLIAKIAELEARLEKLEK